MGRAYRRCKVPLVSAPLDLRGDVVKLLHALIDVESVSGNETQIADLVEQSLQPFGQLKVLRDGNVVVARTELGRSERVVIAGHLDTVPIAGNLPSWTTHDSAGKEIIWGRGACDMKGGVAVQLSAAAALVHPRRDVTWVFYDNEEVEESRNGLGRTDQRPDRGRLPGNNVADRRVDRCRRALRPSVDGSQRHSRCRSGAATSELPPVAANRGRRTDLPGRVECRPDQWRHCGQCHPRSLRHRRQLSIRP